MQTILIGISSGIAAFKALDLVKRLRKRGYNVIVIMTDHAKRMLSEQDLAEASNNPVASELFPPGFDYQDVLKHRKVEHISLADMASVICVIPGTANLLAKIAHGIADDLLTTTLLASHAAVLLCPSMNVNMWDKEVTQANLTELRARGFFFVPPVKGRLACGYEGMGRLAEIDVIEQEILTLAEERRTLWGKRILVTAGGTEEAVDDVRVLTNKSSGKMGIRIAEECVKRGACVTLIRGRTNVDPAILMNDIRVSSANDMLNAIRNNVGEADVIIHAAAVGDFTVKNAVVGKISSAKRLTLELVPNVKIIDQIKHLNPDILLVGFKAECNLTEKALIEKARNMAYRTKTDLVVANDVGKHTVFDSDLNEVLLVRASGRTKKIERADKRVIARAIVAEMITLLSAH